MLGWCDLWGSCRPVAVAPDGMLETYSLSRGSGCSGLVFLCARGRHVSRSKGIIRTCCLRKKNTPGHVHWSSVELCDHYAGYKGAHHLTTMPPSHSSDLNEVDKRVADPLLVAPVPWFGRRDEKLVQQTTKRLCLKRTASICRKEAQKAMVVQTPLAHTTADTAIVTFIRHSGICLPTFDLI